ncbi:enoyl-CoA hydratase-related protein, partial [Nocardia miyunensis]|uniref:enoyl-CoA hydratase-related protein n=1 Tax=Nocardia miyunensis TaxID=282684 RepID=UPI00157C3C9D
MHIRYEATGAVATITLDRPEAANAQNIALLDELDAAWTRAAADDDVAVIVLRAEGKHFSAGHDLKGGGSSAAPSKMTLDRLYEFETRRYLEYSLR